MKILIEGIRTVECRRCKSLLEYEYDDIKSEQTHMNECKSYVVCPKCDCQVTVEK